MKDLRFDRMDFELSSHLERSCFGGILLLPTIFHVSSPHCRLFFPSQSHILLLLDLSTLTHKARPISSSLSSIQIAGLTDGVIESTSGFNGSSSSTGNS